jgi:type VII secretion integral membrane protein EccD
VLVAAVLLTVLTPRGDAPFVAAALVAAVGTLAAFTAVVTEASATDAAAVCTVTAIGAIAFLPALCVRFVRLPIGYGDAADGTEPADEARIAALARRGHEMLLGLVGGCAAVIVGAGVVLGFAHSAWAQLLALAAGLATLLRARLFRYTAQVGALVAAGVGAIALLVLGLALNPPTTTEADIRTLWLAAAVAVGAGLLTAVALTVPKQGVSPLLGRLLDLVEGAVLLSLIPLALAVLNVYATARGMTSG